MVKKLQIYTARALNEHDELTIDTDGIIARNPLTSSSSIEQSLKMIGSHILYGSKESVAQNSCWISHSKNIQMVISGYSYSSNSSLHERSNIAIIENHNNTLYKANIEDITIEKLIKASCEMVSSLNLDLSNAQQIQQLWKCGLLIDSSGKKYQNWQGIASNFAMKSGELLALNRIGTEHIKYILDALTADIIYALSYCSEKCMDDIIDEVVRHKNEIMNCIDMMPILFVNFYKETYDSKKEIYNIVGECDLNSHDPLAIESFLKFTKKLFLKQILYQVFNINPYSAKIIEDNRHLAVLGIPNTNNPIDLFGEKIHLTQHKYNHNYQFTAVEKQEIIAIVDYETPNEGAYMLYNENNRLVYIPQKTKVLNCKNRLNRG